jgi:hypothetical protein
VKAFKNEHVAIGLDFKRIFIFEDTIRIRRFKFGDPGNKVEYCTLLHAIWGYRYSLK